MTLRRRVGRRGDSKRLLTSCGSSGYFTAWTLASPARHGHNVIADTRSLHAPVTPSPAFVDCLIATRDALERSARLLESVHAGTRNSRMQIAVSRHRIVASRKAIDSAPRAESDAPSERAAEP